MSYQSEAQLEEQMIRQLVGQGFERTYVSDRDGLFSNLKTQLEKFNDKAFTTKEFDKILNYLYKGGVCQKALNLRDRFLLELEDGTNFYVRFFDVDSHSDNLWQVTNQVTQEGTYVNRYDVTLLVNGLPLVHIELKRRGLELKEAFNQLGRYQKHSFWANGGIYQFTQIFVISNGVETKYLANNRTSSFKQTTYWAKENNEKISDLTEFSKEFLTPKRLTDVIGKYIVINTDKQLMVLRPYQIYATEAMVDLVKQGEGNGYIWHTTGSGKTLTSFKASQIITELPEVSKVVFVVDRKDLDYQTMREFNSFRKGSVDSTSNTKSLVKQLTDERKLIVTTIQKLHLAITKARFSGRIEELKSQKMVFIFDECHRSQFGDTHKNIIDFFPNNQLFGFTGTPIFAVNASKNDMGKRTTKDLFGNCLHKYVITDAIRDQKVLPFSVEYVGKYKNTSANFVDIEVEAIDTAEVLNSEVRLEKITDYIINYHDSKTFDRDCTAIFATSSIDNLIAYYDIFKKKKETGEHDLRVATIFSYRANEEDKDANDMMADEVMGMDEETVSQLGSKHTREKLDEMMSDYNGMYGTSFSTKDRGFDNYFQDLSKRVKEREKVGASDKDRLDILLVVNMFLTGFDAKKVNTLYTDKNLRYHGLIQAFSRTNRIMGEKKSHGNILCFRNLKKKTDEAVTLYSNKDALEVVLLPDFDKVMDTLAGAIAGLLSITPSLASVDQLQSEDDELKFVKSFRKVIRAKNVAESFSDFSWEEMPISQQDFMDYQSKYLSIRDKVKSDTQAQKTSILNDIDFEVELIHRDKINVAYIIGLLSRLKKATPAQIAKEKKAILDMIAGEVSLRSKRELIEKFINENLPLITDIDSIPDEFERFIREEKTLALDKICAEEELDKQQFSALMETYVYSSQEPIREDIFACLGNRPSVLKAREIGERILGRMKEFVAVFVDGMAA